MYGKLFSRLRRSCRNVPNAARSVRTSTKASLPSVSSSNTPVNCDQPNQQCDQNPATDYHTFGRDHLDAESSSDEQTFPDEPTNSTSFDRVSNSSSNSSLINNVTKQSSDQYWISFINCQSYKNWLKVGLALRSVCNFLSPVLEEIVNEMHSNLLAKHGYAHITQDQVDMYKKNTSESDTLRGWVRDVSKLHRHSVSPGEIFRVSRVVKWPTSEGGWEIARIFMSKVYRSGGDGIDVSAFDVSALLNFMHKCRLVDGYVHDFNNVKNVLQVRNNTMHNPNLQVDNNELEESFDLIFSLVQDTYLQKHAEKYLSTEEFYNGLKEIKADTFDLLTSARHSLNVLNDEAFDPDLNLTHPYPRTLALVKDILPKILSLPHVEVSADLTRIQSQIVEMENKVTKEYQLADKKIKQISASVLHMNQKLDHLREVLVQKQRNSNKFAKYPGPRRKRKRTKDTSDHGSNFRAGERGKFASSGSGILVDVPSQKKSPFQLSQTKHVRFDKSSFSGKKSCSCLSSCSCSSNDEESEESGISSSSELPSTSSSRIISIKRRFSNFLDDGEDQDEDHEYDEEDFSDKYKPIAKKRKKGSSNTGLDDYKPKPGDSIMLPTSKKGNRNGDGGNNPFCKKLQAFLKKQPNNAGASFSTRVDSKKKYFSSVSFQSYYAVTSPVLTSTADKAKDHAAYEAIKRLQSATSDQKILLQEAKQQLDDYSKTETGKLPNYTCFKTTADLYVSYAHLISNKLFESRTTIPRRVFVEATCTSVNPNVDIEISALKSALQGTDVGYYRSPDVRSILNEYCLANGATLPFVRVTSASDPNNRGLSRSCLLKSFLKESFLNESGSSDNIIQSSVQEKRERMESTQPEFLEAKSTQAHRSEDLAEESAAANILRQLSFSESYLAQIYGQCKSELKSVASDLDLSVAYHTLKSPYSDKHSTTAYSCVVTSLCLGQVMDSFTVSSDSTGYNTKEEACESAARNALLLLGMDIVLSS